MVDTPESPPLTVAPAPGAAPQPQASGQPGPAPGRQMLADFSLSLVNRTGAYYVCRDLVQGLPALFQDVRRWRLLGRRDIDGTPRKILARLMMAEMKALRGSDWLPWPMPRGGQGLPVLYLDPLYVLRARLQAKDIVLCHDVGPVTHPELFDGQTVSIYADAYAKIAATRPGMVFVSDASKDAFTAVFGRDFRFLHTIPLYVRPGSLAGEASQPAGVQTPYLLTVGALERRKNHMRLLQAYRDGGFHERGIGLVFCGPRGIDADLIVATAQQTPGVHITGYVTDAELRWLYRNASGFVLPSLLEGFGLPALEAGRQGLVPVISRGGALEEAAGVDGIAIDPLSIEDIVGGMQRVLAMPEEERSARVAALRAHADKLTLERFLASWQALLSSELL